MNRRFRPPNANVELGSSREAMDFLRTLGVVQTPAISADASQDIDAATLDKSGWTSKQPLASEVDSLDEELHIEPFSIVNVQRFIGGALESAQDTVAEEVPVAIEFNGISQVVMLTTPQDLKDFAVGYSLTEGILDSAQDIFDCEVIPVETGIRVKMQVSNECFARLKERRRTMAGRTGCGLCGVDSLSQVRRTLKPVSGTSPSYESIRAALNNLQDLQPLFTQTGATHAAFWLDGDGKVTCAREDVGRHNALDKLIGALALNKCNFSNGAVLITSRASFEIVQKAASVGIGMVAAVSAPTGLAIQVANELNVALIGFMRSKGYVVYAPALGVRP